MTPEKRAAIARLGGLATTQKLGPKRLSEMGRKGGRKGGLVAAQTLSPEELSERGRNGGRMRAHLRWHVDRNLFSPSCALCIASQLEQVSNKENQNEQHTNVQKL